MVKFRGIAFTWIILIITALTSPVIPEVVYRVDPLALLSGTLRTYQKAGCEKEQVSLSCPRGTSISIELAQYGSANEGGADTNICARSTVDTLMGDFNQHLPPSGNSDTDIDVKPVESCFWPNALQYSLLQTVVEACQKKRHCKFHASPKAFGGDPCPAVTKFVEVAFKCRPYEFRSKVACENNVIQLVCNPYSRIAIYGANFGRTEYESVQCSQPQGVKEETCLASYATEKVMEICHGKRRCTISADINTFDNPCRSESRVYLKVVYTCIPRKVLNDRYNFAMEADEPEQADSEETHDDLYDEDQFFKESEAIPFQPKFQEETNSHNNFHEKQSLVPSSSANPPMRSMDVNQLEVPLNSANSSNNITLPQAPHKNTAKNTSFILYDATSSINMNVSNNNDTTTDDGKAIGFIAEWINAFIFVAQNQEKFYLYLIVSVTAGILLCLTLVIGRLLLQKRRLKKDTQVQTFNSSADTALPNGFADEISDIDGDIDLVTPLPVPSVSRREHYGGGFTPSPGPYGNIGTSTLSHTSTTMLVPPNVSSSGQSSANIMGTPNLLVCSSNGSQMGPVITVGGIPQYQPPYMTNMIVSHHGTLRRQQLQQQQQHRDFDGSHLPRSLSKDDPNNQQYFYG